MNPVAIVYAHKQEFPVFQKSQSMIHRHVIFVTALIISFLIATGCGGGGKQQASAGPTPTPAPAPSASPTPTPVPGGISATPTSLNFGNLAVSTTATQTVKVTNAGTASISITKDTISGTGFSTGLTTPMTLNAGQSTNVQVVFTPSASGPVNGSLVLTTSTAAAVTIALSGTGITPQAHSVDISWNASSTSNLQGYNVYRGAVSGGPYTKISSTLSSTTLTFTDAAPVSGSSYFYVVTAVDTLGMESSPSNEVHVNVPTP